MSSIRIDFERPLTTELYAIIKLAKELDNPFRITMIKESAVDINKDQTSLIVTNDPRSSLLSFPETLKELIISDCPNLTSLPNFPETLVSLSIVNCPNLTSLPNFPMSIKDVCIRFTPITMLPCDICAVTELMLEDTAIEVLPEFIKFPYIDSLNNPFTDILSNYSNGSLGDMDWNQIDDFFAEYEPKAAIVREQRKQGIPFDTIVREMLQKEAEEEAAKKSTKKSIAKKV